MPWTECDIERLKVLWTEGLSAAAIAARLGGVTRNAVIGKVHRLGLAGRTPRPTQRAPKTRPTNPRRAAVKRPAFRASPVEPLTLVDAPPLGPAPPAAITVATVANGLCRWPEGDPKQPGFHFCGRACDHARPYCAHHQARATSREPPRRAKAAPNIVISGRNERDLAPANGAIQA